PGLARGLTTMARPKKSPSERLSKQMSVRFTDEEANAVLDRAERDGVPMAEWIRRTCVAVASDRDLVQEVAHLEAEVRRLQQEVLRQSTVLGQHADAIRRAGL